MSSLVLQSEQRFADAIASIVAGVASFQSSRLLAMARQSPKRATALIVRQAIAIDSASRRSAEALVASKNVFESLWDLVGAEQFVRMLDNELIVSTIAKKVLLHRLGSRPQEFSYDVLRTLAYSVHEPEVTSRSQYLLSTHIDSFADRLMKEGHGLSADIQQLKISIQDFGFSQELNEALSKVEDDLANDGDGFDQAAMLKTLRTFFEQLDREVMVEMKRISPDANNTPQTQAGNVLEYLAQRDLITQQLKTLGKGLYGVMSHEGVHKLKADRDYARLCYNMTIEYARILMFELERWQTVQGKRA